tara:strand:- start:373 stop:873 length:501 start_codon:yes stop_codon:yes gene_type:complete
MATALFITKDDLIRQTALSGNLDFDKIVHFIKISQDIHIHQLLGSRLYNRLQSDILADTLSGVYETLVVDYVKPILTQYTFLEYLPFSQYTISNKGVFKSRSENSDIPDSSEIDKMKDAARDTAESYSNRMVDYLEFNTTIYPEYLTNNNEEISPKKRINFGGWHL